MRHILFTLKGCSETLLDDESHIRNVLVHAAHLCQSTLLDVSSHKFDPQGVTAIALLAESHISIHTWPEKGQAAVDVFTCGNCNPELAGEHIANGVRGMGRTRQLVKRY